MWQVWPPEKDDANQHHYTKNQPIKFWAQSKRSNEAEFLLNNKDLVFIYETKTGPEHLDYDWYFSWDDVSLADLQIFLNKYYNINFAKKPELRRIKEKNIIIISDGETKISLMLNMPTRPHNGKNVEATLTIGERRPIKCWAENENDKLELYHYVPFNKGERILGREGIFALACAQSRFNKNFWTHDEYNDINRNWDLSAEARIIHHGGFVPRNELCKIMDYSPLYLFRGWGIKPIKSSIAQKILEYYYSHKAPW